MQRALAASLIVGVLCSVIGCFVVLRAMAFLGDALAHAILPGVAIAYLLGANLLPARSSPRSLVAVGIGAVLARRRHQGGHRHRHPLRRGAVARRRAHQHRAELRHRPHPHPLRQRARRDRRGDLWLTGLLALVVLVDAARVLQGVPLAASTPCSRTCWASGRRCCASLMLVLLALTIVVSLQTVGVGLVAAHAGHARRDRLPAHAPPAGDDGRRRAHRRGLQRRRAVSRATTSTWRRGRPSCSWPRRPSLVRVALRRAAARPAVAPRGRAGAPP